MTIHEALFSTLRQPLLTALYLLLALQLTLFLTSVRDGRSGRIRLFLLLHSLFTFVCLWLTYMDVHEYNFRTDVPIPMPDALSAVTLLPVWTLVLYEVLTAVILAAEIREHVHYLKNHPTALSIKETTDMLPAGIAFGREDGTVVFSNLAMNSLSRALTGKELTDLSAFRSAAGVTGPETQLTLSAGSAVWQLTKNTLRADDGLYTQLTAANITEQTAITRELEKKNEKLRELHARLEIYNRQAERIIIAQELLTARMTVHSEVGNVLLESRQYMKNPASFDEEKLLQALKNTNTYLLREYEEDDTARDPLTEAVETAEIIGVDVLISGPVPSEEPCRSLLAAAIGECASNTVKHAGGDRLTAEIRSTDTETVCLLRSNGEAPKEPIRESGGLLSLRSLVEKENGSMRTDVSPSFTLEIRIPRTK